MAEFAYDNQVIDDPTNRRYFSVAQANRALVLVKRIVADIVQEYNRLMELQETLETIETCTGEWELQPHRDSLVDTADRIRCYLDELDDVGVILQDWELGVVDFPSLIEGREVHLCWHSGESKVSHWHEVDLCSAERNHIKSLQQELTVAQAS